MNYKKYFLFLLFAPALCIIILSFHVLYNDPLQIFHKGYFIEEQFVEEMREQNKGIIDNVDFNGAILGTSMLENSSSLEFASLLGGKFVNLSMGGSSFYERHFILDYLLQNKKLSSLIYSFDYCFLENKNSIQPKNGTWPTLYTGNIKDLLMYYYDMKSIKRAVKNSISFVNTKATIDFFDHPKSWATKKHRIASFGGLDNWIQYMDMMGGKHFFVNQLPNILATLPHAIPNIECNATKSKDVKKYIDDNVIRFVKNHQETNFHIIIPPYYRYRYAEMRQVSGSDYALHQESIRHIVNASAQYPNLKVYGFEDMPFLDDIANYRDTSHYHESINSMMAHAVADGTHVLTPENIGSYLAKCDALAQAFDIQKLYDDACALMIKHGLDPKTGEKLH